MITKLKTDLRVLTATAFAIAAIQWTPVAANAQISSPGSTADPASVYSHYDPASQWCNDVLRTLSHAKERASQVLSHGDYERAKATLMDGLYRARPSGTFGQRPLTARAVSRGIELAQNIQRAVQGEASEARTNTHFLFRYYDFLFETANGLDLPLYLPYLRDRGGCVSCGVDSEEVEGRFVQYAKDQVQVILSSLAETNGSQVFPVGSPRAFLKALEMVAKYAASDLRESLWGSRYACAIQELTDLSYRLGRFNAGDHSGYFNEVDAVNSSYFEMSRALDEINPYRSCEYRPRRYYP